MTAPLRGRALCNPVDPTDPERALAAGILILAIEDARLGDQAAAEWLEEDAQPLAELLGVNPVDLGRWREGGVYPGSNERIARIRAHKSERNRRYRERKRQAREAANNGNDQASEI